MILDDIKKSTLKRVEERKKVVSLDKIKLVATKRFDYEKNIEDIKEFNLKNKFAFEEIIRKEGLSFICEVKKASPSKGIMVKEFPYIEIAKDYEKAGADAISVLTEPEYFLGSDEYLIEIKKEVKTLILRKDFIVDEYQIYESKAIGADAVLLICAILDREKIKKYIKICDTLLISALVECHNEDEIEIALGAGARIIGVNNRNLKDFTVDFNNSIRLKKKIKDNILFVAESGIKSEEDIKKLYEAGVDAVLIGETLMKSKDKKARLEELKSGCIIDGKN